MKGFGVFIFLVFCAVQVYSKKYTIVQKKVNWFQANEACLNNGMQLATVNSEAEQIDFAASVTKSGLGINQYIWLAGADLAKEGTFTWMSTGTLFTFNHWADNQPDNSGGEENCVGTYTEGRWNDFTCDYQNFYACEKKPHCNEAGNIRLD